VKRCEDKFTKTFSRILNGTMQVKVGFPSNPSCMKTANSMHNHNTMAPITYQVLEGINEA
jgi:hypothetical protein